MHACVHIGPCVHARVACTFETHARTHLTGDEAGSHPDGSFARAPSLCPPSSFPPAQGVAILGFRGTLGFGV